MQDAVTMWAVDDVGIEFTAGSSEDGKPIGKSAGTGCFGVENRRIRAAGERMLAGLCCADAVDDDEQQRDG